MHPPALHPELRRRLSLQSPPAFSLIEVVLAIGIISFAFVGVFGLLPVGMQTFRQALDMSVESQIRQAVSNEIQGSRFSELSTSSFFQDSFPKFFDSQGMPVPGEAESRIYTIDYGSSAAPAGMILPGGKAANGHVLVLKFEISKRTNPGTIKFFSVTVPDNGF